MKKISRIAVLIFCLLYIFTFKANAISPYVLSYPSTMPGSVYYKMHLVLEAFMEYWYFGNFGKFEYNLKESDKYLVEAKTLFEYNQFLLGYNALKKSDTYFQKTKPFLMRAQKEGKNISEKNNMLRQAAEKHIETLEKIKTEVPPTILWQPEKALSTNLNLLDSINQAELI